MYSFLEKPSKFIQSKAVTYSHLPSFYSDNSVERIPYEVLKTATRNFDENVKLGEGNFGTVYLGKLKEVDRAIKVLKNSAGVEHFERELIILSDDISHLRLLSPVGVSINEVLCLIYPYMSHRSLADRLAMKVVYSQLLCCFVLK